MMGLGETRDECVELLGRMREARIDVVTIGQYLRPSRENLPVVEYVPPSVFDGLRIVGEAMGFRHVFAGPFVRSSYRAEEALLAAARSAPHPPAPSPVGEGGRGLAAEKGRATSAAGGTPEPRP
jgi:lipoate synthase